MIGQESTLHQSAEQPDHEHGPQPQLHARDELSGEDVLPGFTCNVGTLFDVAVQ